MEAGQWWRGPCSLLFMLGISEILHDNTSPFLLKTNVVNYQWNNSTLKFGVLGLPDACLIQVSFLRWLGAGHTPELTWGFRELFRELFRKAL